MAQLLSSRGPSGAQMRASKELGKQRIWSRPQVLQQSRWRGSVLHSYSASKFVNGSRTLSLKCRRSPLVEQRRLGCYAHGDHSHHHHSSDHDHSCCSSSLDYSEDECQVHGDGAADGNRATVLLKQFFRSTGLQRLGWYLEQSKSSSIAKIVFFVAATVFQWYYNHQVDLGDGARVALAQQAAHVCTAMVYVFAGLPAALSLILDIVSLNVDTHVLMNLAVIGTLVAGLPLEGALLLVLFQTSHAVEHMLTEKAQGSLKALFDSVPDHADVVIMNEQGAPDLSSIQHIPASYVEVGQIVFVKPGCQIPLDGAIVHGQALVSAEHITGESIPTLKRPGDIVPAGSLCHDGALCVQTTRSSEDSTPARIAQLARDAQAKRPKLRTFLDIFGETYSKLVIATTVVSFLVMVVCGVPIVGTGASKGALYRAMGLLTVASPCALVMVPMAYVSAIAALASRGILLKGGRVLDAARLCRTVAMDKTGTLTTGSLNVKYIVPVDVENGNGISMKAIRSVAKSLSMRSSHPVSNAVIADAAKSGLGDTDLAVEDFNLVPGGGVSGTVALADGNGQFKSYFGSLEFVSSILEDEMVDKVGHAIEEKGIKNAIISVLVLIDPRTRTAQSVTVFVCEDTLRDASYAAVQNLQKGLWNGSKKPDPSAACDIVMVTGDNEASASRIAVSVGISKVFSNLTPEEKLKIVKQLGEETKRVNTSKKSLVMMIGDGLNDAAALAAARVGIALASPAMAASLASDVVVMNETSGVSSIPVLLRVAQITHRIILQNLVLAAGSIAVLALPTVLGFIPLWLAVMFHEGSTLLVALNSLRILRVSI